MPYEIAGKAGEPYCPSNGSEGDAFMQGFCYRCTKDAQYQETQQGEDGCPIIMGSMIYSVGDPEYPPEWTHDEKGRPLCTAFEVVLGE